MAVDIATSRLRSWHGNHGLARLVAGWMTLGLILLAGSAMATEAVSPISFGILPIGSAAESLEQWRPLLEDLQKRLGRPVTTVSVSSYAGLSSAIGAQRVDVAFVSGKLAVEAVTHQHMQVFAQFLRNDGAKGNVAMLVVRGDSLIHTLADLLAKPGHWRYGRSEKLSVTGYTAPEADVFAPRGLNSDTFFASVLVEDHQSTLLAVVNREVDVATSNNPDMDLFRRHFPDEASQLRVIWRSPLIPSGVLVVREGLSASVRQQLTGFILAYGKAPGEAGVRERAALARIPDLGGFTPQNDQALQPFVDMQYALLRQQAQHGQWVSQQARQARLTQIDQDYQRDSQALLPH
ncbi:phosphate/phosphite/phosphonate ABC transporter substrate-binding protein [Rhodanobacter sp. MP7CTX1]|uniref:phosphate/phosphite/phosphonate ABC transporter substrate-binding protein n=1 Tax=Rhodanobacter sp. MP7CTX1 TaxID=2723084 RepID=UPI00161BBF79|nr:phosphate/phosphite/phosphonate ABC transporter substrate-binding protein [Rhodanobacter sp. MP7CTX1]MBB6186700.1 phosphonate transport system substrate-binding protein [Rhodanobacter sp. MP7CTX1]